MTDTDPSPAIQHTQATEDFLKLVFLFQQSEERVSTSQLAEALNITPASVTEKAKRLSDEGLIDHVPYRGVRLTKEGRRVALYMIRRHRMLEMFLMQHLGYQWDEVHEEAERLEHAVSEKFLERVAALLDYPTHDPHGDPIPDSEGLFPDRAELSLADWPVNKPGRVARILEQSPETLRYLEDKGLLPDAAVTVEQRSSLEGVLHLRVGGEVLVIGHPLALMILVQAPLEG